MTRYKDARLVVVIIITLCVIIRANTGTCTTCDNTTNTTKIGCKPFRGRDAAGSVCTIISHLFERTYNYFVDKQGLAPWRLRRLGKSKLRSASLVKVLSDGKIS